MKVDNDYTIQAIEELDGMIQGIKVAMLTTAMSDGTLRSRPMVTLANTQDNHLWFFTEASSAKVDEIEADSQVNLSYASPERNRYISVSGRARLVCDREKAIALWNPVLKPWFPKGLDDPDLALLQVRVEAAEYWSGPAGRMVQIAGDEMPAQFPKQKSL